MKTDKFYLYHYINIGGKLVEHIRSGIDGAIGEEKCGFREERGFVD